MTTFYPHDVPSNSPKSERKVRERLSNIDDLVVFHSVAWQSRRGGKQGDGEADFVLLVPNLGILILEVKGGGVETIDGLWYSTGRDGIRHSIKNPFDQAKDSKFALLSFFKTVEPTLARIPIVHAVVFPDVGVDQLLGFNAPTEIIIDRTALVRPMLAIERIFQHWGQSGPLSKTDTQRIIGHLAPTIQVKRLLRDDVEDAQQGLLDLTTEQVGLLQALKRVKNAMILGGAGTGKTVLAIEKSRQLAASGFRVLLLCYNAPLRQHLISTLHGSSVEVETFHSLVHREARRANLKIPFHPTSEWYENEASRILNAAAAHNSTQYDGLIIDEAQDFAMEWLSAAQALVAGDGLQFMFADFHQDLYRRGWSVPKGLVEFELTINCRNTGPIAKKVANIFNDRLEGKFIDGPEPKFLQTDYREPLAPNIIRLVESLVLEDKIEPAQLVVLTDSASVVSELRATGVAEHLFTTLDGHGIPVETIHRFKGLERDVVVIALSDATTFADIRAVTYVGLSRAKVGLYVIASRDIKDAIAWSL
ncbi:NERD domain-containing protein [Aeromonas veronii]